jgi:phosphosulfolactate synthase
LRSGSRSKFFEVSTIIKTETQNDLSPIISITSSGNLHQAASREQMLDFLALLQKLEKPRTNGITIVIDRGIGVRQAQDLLETSAKFIDLLKLGWGTGYITANLTEKLKIYNDFGIPVHFGGTLFEISVLHHKFDEFRKMLSSLKITHVEVSNGIAELTPEAKGQYIQDLTQDFVVLSEVGRKDDDKIIDPCLWVREIQADLDAGAWKVITEARESGTAGICRRDGELRYGLIDEITSKVAPEKIVFEAPKKEQQVSFIKRFGFSVNLGNIATNDVIPLATLRLGLRSDTAKEQISTH